MIEKYIEKCPCCGSRIDTRMKVCYKCKSLENRLKHKMKIMIENSTYGLLKCVDIENDEETINTFKKMREDVMSATKGFIEDKIAEYAAKYGIGYDELMSSFNAMTEIGIGYDFNNLEKKLIRFHHFVTYIKLLENDI